MKIKQKLVALYFNEPNPELYRKIDFSSDNLHFEPYFEIDKSTPLEEYDKMVNKLKKSGIDAYSLNIKDNLNTLLNDYFTNKPDVVFNFIELFQEKVELESNIVGLFELLDIPYTGAPMMALLNCQNKYLSKRILRYYNIPTPDFFFVDKKNGKFKNNLNFPLIVKPVCEDASVGIDNNSIVHNERELKKRLEYVFEKINQSAIVEQYIDGREVNVSILGDKYPVVLPLSEIDFSEMPDHLYGIVSYQAKWDPLHEAYHKTIPICPAQLPKKVEKKIKEISISAFKIMGVRDYARVDIRLDKALKPYVLEVNPNPDLTEDAGFMRSAKAAGFSYVKTLKKIIQFAIERNKKRLPKKF
ncbi:MAG: ATP-grasp domain-containing protein [Ignavibacterium sp.]|nr:ATP-grasp domain-containing protein [Ignavibacterium sp.]MCX7612257.1 ATP-grasp domain-containing protein [Ignavibacterium sp.]MDW8374347.1 ATP-grasp domain-containing protein [Ignavibacteriales bacterium]